MHPRISGLNEQKSESYNVQTMHGRLEEILYIVRIVLEDRESCQRRWPRNKICRGTDAVTTEYLYKHHRTTLTRHQVEKNPQQILICNTKSVLYVQRRYRRLWLPQIIDITDRQMASG